MGTIIANRILRHHPNLPIERAVYMAAACSIADFRDSVVPYMRSHPGMKFYNVCLHPKAESDEIQWAFLDLTPRGSLLVWIDNFLSDLKTEADLTLGKWNNIILASHLIPIDVRHRVLLRSFDAGTSTVPQVHGGLDNFAFWDPEIWGETK